MSVTLTHQDISHYLFTPTDAKSLGKTSLPCLPDDSGGGGGCLVYAEEAQHKRSIYSDFVQKDRDDTEKKFLITVIL